MSVKGFPTRNGPRLVQLDPPGDHPINILLVGDTALGENFQNAIKARGGRSILEDHGYDYAFANFSEMLHASDLVIANLETPITNISRSPFEGRKRYIHRDNIEHTPACLARHNIKNVSLANNHTFDYGAEGFNQTVEVLASSGCNLFGAGDTLEASVQPLLIDIGGEKLAILGAFEKQNDYQQIYGVYAERDRGGLCPLDDPLLINQIITLKRVHPGIFIIVFPHWGENYRLRSDLQKMAATALADAGADLVLGHGAHCFQEIERIYRTWVFYGIGNFVFNSPGRYRKFNAPPISLIAQLQIKKPQLTLRVYPIFTSNLETHYQGRFVTEDQFRITLGLLKRISPNSSELAKSFRADQEDGRFFIELAVR
jgi:Bacterial capsule synthesis protein PGA_cap